jgi:hypothetical protein
MRRGPTLVTQRPLSSDHLRSPATAVAHSSSAPVAGTGVLAARFDVACAVAAGAAALVVYVRTLAPGLIALLDSPMFQFIGRVLGVPHNPGYPLYVMLTYPVALVPLGSLPYRINLFSAVFAALTIRRGGNGGSLPRSPCSLPGSGITPRSWRSRQRPQTRHVNPGHEQGTFTRHREPL